MMKRVYTDAEFLKLKRRLIDRINKAQKREKWLIELLKQVDRK